MNSVTELKQRFSFVFSEDQATILANAIYDSYNELVKASDFKELKQVVEELANAQKELADAQKRTEHRVEELADAQKRTEHRVEELANAQKRTEHRVEELAKAQEQTSKEVRNLARQVGGLSESFGASLEDFALDLVPELLEKYWNLKVVTCSREEVKITSENTIEFDIYIEGFLEGKKVIVLGEVKSHITKDEVIKHYRLVDKVKPIYSDAEVRVVFFGYRAYKEVRELIQSLGGYMIFSNSKTL